MNYVKTLPKWSEEEFNKLKEAARSAGVKKPPKPKRNRRGRLKINK